MRYFIKLPNELLGPLTMEEIRQRITEQMLQESDAVRLEESETWTRLGSLPEFVETFKSQPPRSNPLATTSLVMGIGAPLALGLALLWGSGFLLLSHLLCALGAILSGHLAISNIKDSLCEIKGRGMARSGLALGYLMLALTASQADFNPSGSRIQAKGHQTQCINNCKQIIITLRAYAEDHDGKYPDADNPDVRNVNDVFRVLFKEGYLETEKIFGAYDSPYKPDGNIGEAPDYLEAVKPGENHWAMTKGLMVTMGDGIPLVFENPSEASWPPQWNANFASIAKPGRVWTGGKVIIGFNDTSIEVLPLATNKGERIGLKTYPDGTSEGKNAFSHVDPKLEILNVAK